MGTLVTGGEEPESPAPPPPTLYLGIDGTGVPMRAPELQGRAGKQPDGSARTREAKLCTVWSAEKRDEQGRPLRDPDSVTYTAAIESAATLDTDHHIGQPIGKLVVHFLDITNNPDTCRGVVCLTSSADHLGCLVNLSCRQDILSLGSDRK